MANYLTVSAVGPAPFSAGPGPGAVHRMAEHWERELARVLPDRPDLIVLPETCDRPADCPPERRAEYYAERGDRMLELFRRIARDNHCGIAYSAVRVLPDGTLRNSIALLARDGSTAGVYDKNHPLISETEREGILPGAEAPVFGSEFGRAACAICFDLNFEDLRRKYAAEKPDLILFSSNYHGGLMQKYWAYSCRAYFTGSIAGLPCSILSPLGETLAESTNYTDFATAAVNLDRCSVHLDGNAAKLRAAKEKYGRAIRVSDPGYLGSVLLTSETADFSAQDVVKEFGIELLDDYFGRSLAFQNSRRARH